MAADAWLFRLPSDQVVAVLTLDVQTPDLHNDAARVVEALEQLRNAQVAVNGLDMSDYFAGHAADAMTISASDESDLLPERHHILVVPYPYDPTIVGGDVANYVLRPRTGAHRDEHFRLIWPPELNETAGSICAVTPYTGLIWGKHSAIRDSILLSTVQAVGTATRFRQIWTDAYRHVRDFREAKQSVGQQTRHDLEELVDHLGNLELDLTFSVGFPLLRADTFYSSLVEAMDLQTQAESLSQMFNQLGGSVRSEITAIEIRERHATTESRQRRNAVLLSFIGVPLGFFIAFFGLDTTEVHKDIGMFDSRYLAIYIAALLIGVVPLAITFLPTLVSRLKKIRRP
jgi:hypothetical protein